MKSGARDTREPGRMGGLTQTDPRRRAGFTVIELVFVIAVIFLLMGLLIVGIHHVTGFAKGTADRAAVTALKDGVAHFEQQFGFVPPLVVDGYASNSGFPAGTGPLHAVSGQNVPLVFSFQPSVVGNNNPCVPFLRNIPRTPSLSNTTGSGGDDMRFSMYSMPYYLIGVLGKSDAVNPTSDPPVDGVDGPGFCTPKRDGTFEKSGRKFQPFYDPKRSDAIYQDPTANTNGHIELRDSHGVAFRYYRWATDLAVMDPNLPVPTTQDKYAALNVPEMVGDAHTVANVRDAAYAIVAAGPNGVFGDEDLLPMGHPQRMSFPDMAAKIGLSVSSAPTAAEYAKVRAAAAADNIVEVGR